MAKVTGIGGVFITAENNEALQKWYEDSLNIPRADHGACEFKWKENTGKDAFSIFWVASKGEDYFKPGRSPYIINFRVDGLDELLANLKSKGAQVSPEIKEESYGRFAWVIDPEGNKVELWEPK